eukprot:gnl/TRDRNA2_/TRDRNA2_36070_c0_seq1.p1 gnl/TRDRNA2_/TRDRNA2_36070_c0~~gnl/TRDRNA2_/TRDRNA2_36070_c0_seq1.p1  ORF type:complete len:503 (+),score=60.99 gnl/TRDRNA2_/TRDRNA2_36070_c0_seq1:188-1696(+)
MSAIPGILLAAFVAQAHVATKRAREEHKSSLGLVNSLAAVEATAATTITSATKATAAAASMAVAKVMGGGLHLQGTLGAGADVAAAMAVSAAPPRHFGNLRGILHGQAQRSRGRGQGHRSWTRRAPSKFRQASARVLSSLDCAICLNTFTDPISLSCGHTFCRHCVHQSLTVSKRACPQCRQPSFVSAADAAPNWVIRDLCMKLDPDAYAHRLREAAEELSQFSNTLPVLFQKPVLFPGQQIQFVPRYHLMAQRIQDVLPTHFAYFAVKKHRQVAPGDIGLKARVTGTCLLSDHSCLVGATIESRFAVSKEWSDGNNSEELHYIERSQTLDDEDEDTSGAMFQRAMTFADELVAFAKGYNATYGIEDFVEIPAPSAADGRYSTVKTMSTISLWLAGFVSNHVPLNLNSSALHQLQFQLLNTRSASHRMVTIGTHFHSTAQHQSVPQRISDDMLMSRHAREATWLVSVAAGAFVGILSALCLRRFRARGSNVGKERPLAACGG